MNHAYLSLLAVALYLLTY